MFHVWGHFIHLPCIQLKQLQFSEPSMIIIHKESQLACTTKDGTTKGVRESKDGENMNA